MDGDEEYSAEPFSCSRITTSRKKKSKNNKKRFSDEQIRSLESMFESETRLEPRKKVQLAKELGLQPRQVAIWFQNKRARWKSKQLERDYTILRNNYNSLASRFEALKKEKQALVSQLQKLSGEKMKAGEAGECSVQDEDANCKCESEANKANLSLERTEHGLGILSDEDSSIKTEYFEIQDEPPILMSMVEPGEESLTSQEDWGSLESDALFDQSSSSYQWWDFWA